MPRAAPPDPHVPPPPPAEALACVLPGRRASALLPPVLRGLLDDGSAVREAWYGAVAELPLDRIVATAAAMRAAAPPDLAAAAPTAHGSAARYRLDAAHDGRRRSLSLGGGDGRARFRPSLFSRRRRVAGRRR